MHRVIEFVRVTAGIAVAALLVSIGCGGGSSSTSPSPAPTPAPAPLPATIDELAAVARTPEQLLSWMRANIAGFTPASMDDWRYTSPPDLFASKRSDCIPQSAFARYVLAKNGDATRLLFVLRNGLSTHAVCSWTGSDGRLYFIENAFGGHYGIHGPFDSVNQITTLVSDWLVASDGQRARYDVRDFSGVSYGIDWLTFIRRGDVALFRPLVDCPAAAGRVAPVIVAAYFDTNHRSDTIRDADQAVLAEAGRLAAAWALQRALIHS